MKKNILTLFCVSLCVLSAQFVGADNHDSVVKFKELPTKAQIFIGTYFPAVKVSKCILDNKWRIYEVEMQNGYEIDFDKNGDWTEIESRDEAFPANIVGLLPADAVKYLKDDFPQVGVDKISRLSSGYKVELMTKPETEVKFTVDGKLINKKVDK